MGLYETAFGESLFTKLVERFRAENIVDTESLAARMCCEPHEAHAYIGAIRENRPWHPNVSLSLIHQLGWDVDLSIVEGSPCVNQ